MCSLSVSLSLQKITSAYENQCLLGADLKFENVSDDLVSMTMQNEFEGPKLNGDEFLDVSNVFNSTHLNFLGLRATDKIRASQAEKLKNRK